MKKVPILFCCVLLAALLTLPNYSDASPCFNKSLTQSTKSSTILSRGKVNDLKTLEPLRQAFERDHGKVRLVALLSPT